MNSIAVATAFVGSRWFTASTVVGATTMNQLKENIDNVQVGLQSGVEAAIDEVYHRYRNAAV